jgi:uncharacterized repeat protein (TIGR01451 family)
MNKLYLLTVLAIVTLALSNPSKILADTTCQPIYGGGQTCTTTEDLNINKKVLNTQSNQYVDNLGINDTKYYPGNTTTFQISLTNTSKRNIGNIAVKDIFPDYLTYSSGPGSYDSDTKTLTFQVNNLAINETRSYTITGKVVDGTLIPINQDSVVCVVNQATATDVDNSSRVSQDNAQFCIQKSNVATTTKVTFPITTTPKTGAESLALIALIPTGISGLMLRKHAINKEGKK